MSNADKLQPCGLCFKPLGGGRVIHFMGSTIHNACVPPEYADEMKDIYPDAPSGRWGIVVEWGERGLTCSAWMQRTDEPTIDDAKEFDTEADAAQFILQVTPCPYDRSLAPQEFDDVPKEG